MSAGELPDILTALATLEAAISAVTRVYVEPPDSLAAANLPAVVHDLGKGSMSILTAGKSKWEISHVIPAALIVAPISKGVGRAKGDAEALLDDYLDMLIDHDTLSGQVKSVTAVDWEFQIVPYGKVEYAAISLNITVLVVKGASA